ncbi:MAG: hypothetical protein IKC14_04625 [Kiritimatiellae bacterium]|nr:hypothetical protein [Kiritimatiellia bacterium]
MKTNSRSFRIKAGIAAALLFALSAQAIDFKYAEAGEYDVNVNTNWVGDVAPNGVDEVANFALDLQGWQTFYFNEEITLGTLWYGDTRNQTGGQTFYGNQTGESGGLLVMKVSSGHAKIDKANGNHAKKTEFHVPIRLDSDTEFGNSNIGGAFETYFAGEISGTGSVIKIGAVTRFYWGLNDRTANTYTGSTTVQAGEFHLNKNGVIGVPGDLIVEGGTAVVDRNHNIGDAGVVTLKNSGGLDFRRFTDTVGGLESDSSTAWFSGGGCNVTLADDTNRTFAAKLSGTGTITKQGAGLWTLSGITAFAGTLNVKGTGGVLIDSVASNMTVKVSDGGVLGGSGVISNQITCTTGVLAPGSKGTDGTLELAGGIAVSQSVGYTWKLGALSEETGCGKLLLSGGASDLGDEVAMTLDFSGLDEADRPTLGASAGFWRKPHAWTIFDRTGDATCEPFALTLTNPSGWGSDGRGVFRVTAGTGNELKLEYTPPHFALMVIIK